MRETQDKVSRQSCSEANSGKLEHQSFESHGLERSETSMIFSRLSLPKEFYYHIPCQALAELRQSLQPVQQSLIDLMLSTPSSLLWHLDPDSSCAYTIGNDKTCYVRPIPLAINCHGLDFGDHKLIIQDVKSRTGP